MLEVNDIVAGEYGLRDIFFHFLYFYSINHITGLLLTDYRWPHLVGPDHLYQDLLANLLICS